MFCCENSAIVFYIVMPYNHDQIYFVYASMKSRCYNRSDSRYPNFGGQGIKVCDRWMERVVGFANFTEDMGTRPKGYVLDREDRHGDYSPENCRWSTLSASSHKRQRRSNNTSGVVGVYYHNSLQKWHATITIDKQRQHLGWFEVKEEAVKARKKAEEYYADTGSL